MEAKFCKSFSQKNAYLIGLGTHITPEINTEKKGLFVRITREDGSFIDGEQVHYNPKRLNIAIVNAIEWEFDRYIKKSVPFKRSRKKAQDPSQGNLL